ncbi:sigma-70 family RNA polymerase sigma factor, partial [Anaerovorax odorimutans]|nr:sigma-70 family RNA polymerase sigma factor [Anaerovorax odorimutans]
MADKTALYILWEETAGGKPRYYISFLDGQAVPHEVEVSYAVFQEMGDFVKKERNLQRWTERHVEQSQLSETTLHKRALKPPDNVEDTVLTNLYNQ